MGEFLMPSLGADMETGKLIEWEKQPGDSVKRGDVIAVVETQKGAIEIEVYEDGVLESCLVDLDMPVPVGTVLAIINNGDSPGAAPLSQGTAVSAPPDTSPPTGLSPEAALSESPSAVSDPLLSDPVGTDRESSSRIRISPAARRFAQQKSIDYTSMRGTGSDGAIVLADVQPSSDTVLQDPQPVSPQPDWSGMRSAIAAAMSRSKREIPHYYLSHSVDLGKSLDFLAEVNATRLPAERILISVLYLKAMALALKKFPEFNGHYTEDRYTASAAIHIGMAIHIRGGGLVAPAIHDAQNLSLYELMDKLRDLVTRVRAGRFRAAELTGPTVTLSSLGDRGVDCLYAVIYPPQVAIVGIGSPVQGQRLVNGDNHSVTTVQVTLAADHRVSDGHRGSLFLRKLDSLLQHPEVL